MEEDIRKNVLKINFLQIEIKMDEKTDIISLVPTLILEQIIQYIDIFSVAQCFKVSKHWKKIFYDLKIESKLQSKWRFAKPKIMKREGFTNYNVIIR